MEKLESDLETLMKEKMESDKAYMKRLHDLEKRRRLLKGKSQVIPNSGGGRELNLNDSGEAEITTTTHSVVGAKTKKDNQGRKNPQLEQGVIPHLCVIRGCDLDRIDEIKKNLDKQNLELFGQSCFGHLLKINSNDLRFQGQVFAQLLMHLDMDASNNERQLVFSIRNSRVTFSVKQFALITGLRLGTSSSAAATTTSSQRSSSIQMNVLRGKQRTTWKDFEEAFVHVSREHEGKGELTLKLALLYFVFGILLPKQPHTDKIEAGYLHLVEDVEEFNAFCWGRVSYDFLVSSVLSARSSMDSLKLVGCCKRARRKEKQARLSVDGFVFALQMWCYEVMPSLAEYCTDNIINCTLHPRILRWTTPKRLIRFEYLKTFFAPGGEGHLVVDGIKEEVEELSPQHKRAKVRSSNKDQKCSTSSRANNEDVIIIISDGEEDDKNKLSDDDSCSTTFMDNLVANLN